MPVLAEVVSAGESRGGNRAPGHQNGKELHHGPLRHVQDRYLY